MILTDINVELDVNLISQFYFADSWISKNWMFHYFGKCFIIKGHVNYVFTINYSQYFLNTHGCYVIYKLLWLNKKLTSFQQNSK